jgi:hypothetical protein
VTTPAERIIELRYAISMERYMGGDVSYIHYLETELERARNECNPNPDVENNPQTAHQGFGLSGPDPEPDPDGA